MKQFIAHVAIVVEDYDEAIHFYCQQLNFDLIEDTVLSPEKRWVLVSPKGAKECCILLAKAANPTQAKSVGCQTGGRVGFFLFTDDFDRDYKDLLTKDVVFVRPPKVEPYGKVAVFEDLYGNQWDLLEPNENNALFKSNF